jgi:hypothetical protein
MSIDNIENMTIGHIRTLANEGIKQYFVYDVNDRIIEVYEVFTNAKDGAPCLKTTYTYWGTSKRVKLMKEYLSTWDISWES